MMRALRAVSSERGRDPRDFALVAYGGSGPVHAAGLAAELGVRTVLVPPLAGLFSPPACCSPGPSSTTSLLPRRRARRRPERCSRARGRDARRASPARRAARSASGVRQRRAALRRPELGHRGRPAGRRSTGRRSTRWSPAFEDEHERLYGVRDEAGTPSRSARCDSRCSGRTSTRRSAVARRADAPARGTRLADFAATAGRDAGAHARVDRRASRAGPLLIDEYDTTVVVPPGWTVRRDGDERRADPGRPQRAAAARHRSRTRSSRRSSATRSRRSPTRWRRRSSAPPTRRWCATRWTSRPRSATRPARRWRRR